MVFSEINPDGSEKVLDAAGAAKTHEVGLPRGWRATAKPGCVYLHLFDRPENGLVSVKGLTGTVKRVTLVADPQHRALKFKQGTGGDFTATLPEGIWDSRATVLKLDMFVGHENHGPQSDESAATSGIVQKDDGHAVDVSADFRHK
jgi:hypothetical protein